MAMCFGSNTANKENRDVLNKCLSKFTQLMDLERYALEDGNDKTIREDIKEETGLVFKWGRYGHRVFFHWGFNLDPQESSVLGGCVDATIDEAESDSEQIKDKIYGIIREHQRRRNDAMEHQVFQLAVNADTHLSGRENAIASILYDIHILSDYIEGKTDDVVAPLMKLDLLKADLRDSVSKIAAGEGVAIANNLKRELQKVPVGGDIEQQKEAAEKILSLLKDKLPKIVKENDAIAKAFRVK
jgi:hypothetical protein